MANAGPGSEANPHYPIHGVSCITKSIYTYVYWQVLLAGLVAIYKAYLLLLCQGAPVVQLVRASD